MLKSPHLRRVERRYHPYTFPITDRIALPPARARDLPTLDTLLANRVSCRDLIAPPGIDDLSCVLWLTHRVIAARCEQSGFEWQHRPVPSAGGRHAIHLLLTDGIHWAMYLPEIHGLGYLAVDLAAARSLTHQRGLLLPACDGLTVWFAGEHARVATKYRHGQSLIWRDAGVLTAHLYLVTEALGLGACALGITGEPHLSSCLHSRRRVAGFGGVVIGKRRTRGGFMNRRGSQESPLQTIERKSAHPPRSE